MHAAETAGEILANLRKTGQILGIEDVLIAASAITHGLTVVTANVRHFAIIEGLRVENWLRPLEQGLFSVDISFWGSCSQG